MSSTNKKMTVQTPSVGADGEQPTTNIINSITPESEEIKSKDRKDRLILLGHKLNQESSKNFLPTINLDGSDAQIASSSWTALHHHRLF